MKKKIVLRGLLGFPLGISIGYIITIMISLIYGTGAYLSCVPALATDLGSEIAAVGFQTVLSGILGSACAIGSVVFEIEEWSITKRTAVHFLILSFSMLPIAYFLYWMEHTIVGFLSYFGIFIGIYIVIWIIQRMIWKKQIKKINDKLSEKR